MEGVEFGEEEEAKKAAKQEAEELAKQEAEALAKQEAEALAKQEAEKKAEEEKNQNPAVDPDLILNKLMQGIRLDGPLLVDANESSGVGLRDTEHIFGCKSDKGSEIAVVVDLEFPEAPIYRLKSNVAIPENTMNIMDSRRISKVKTFSPRANWSKKDASGVQAVAITIPPDYEGQPEDLVLSKYSRADRKARKEKGLENPEQPELQVNVTWYEDRNGQNTTWETRGGCVTLWGEVLAETIMYEAARKQEQKYRDAGGQHATDGAISLRRPEFKEEKLKEEIKEEKLNEDKLGEEKLKEEKPNENLNDQRTKARATYKATWCGDKGIDPSKMTNTDDGKFEAAFEVYWEAKQQ